MATKKPPLKAKVKASPKKTEPIVKTIMVEKKIINWKRVKTGTYFTAKIEGNKLSGLVYRSAGTDIYLCQNQKNGSSCLNKLGYKYSWRICSKRYNDGYNGVTDLDFPTPPDGFVKPVILPSMAGYNPIIEKGYVQFGCKKVKNSNIRLLAKHLKD